MLNKFYHVPADSRLPEAFMDDRERENIPNMADFFKEPYELHYFSWHVHRSNSDFQCSLWIIILCHARRKILFTNVTYNPTCQWLGQQMINAFYEVNDQDNHQRTAMDRKWTVKRKF